MCPLFIVTAFLFEKYRTKWMNFPKPHPFMYVVSVSCPNCSPYNRDYLRMEYEGGGTHSGLQEFSRGDDFQPLVVPRTSLQNVLNPNVFDQRWDQISNLQVTICKFEVPLIKSDLFIFNIIIQYKIR